LKKRREKRRTLKGDNTMKSMRALLLAGAMLFSMSVGATAQQTEKKETVKKPHISFKGVGTKKIVNAVNTTARKAKGTVVHTEKKPAPTPTPKPRH
jgi:hypothetical protein